MLVKKQPNIIYGIRLKLTLISPELKTQGFYASSHKLKVHASADKSPEELTFFQIRKSILIKRKKLKKKKVRKEKGHDQKRIKRKRREKS